MSKQSIAIIGAGLSGAVCAQQLMQAGHKVTVFEKSRGTGGRMAAARVGETSVDLGNPWLCADGNGDFEHWLAQQPSLLSWTANVADFSGDHKAELPAYVAQGRQSAFTRTLLAGAEIKNQTRVAYLWRDEAGVVLRDEQDQALGHFDGVVVATPAPQAVPLLEMTQRFAKRAEQVKTQVTWVVVCQGEPSQELPWQCLEGQHPVLARVVKNSDKPGREGPTTWFIEATDEWSLAHEDTPAEQVYEHLTRELTAVLHHQGVSITLEGGKAHRWLYARHISELSEPCLFSWDDRLGVCGDWLAHQGAAGAWHSGQAVAQAWLEALDGRS